MRCDKIRSPQHQAQRHEARAERPTATPFRKAGARQKPVWKFPVTSDGPADRVRESMKNVAHHHAVFARTSRSVGEL